VYRELVSEIIISKFRMNFTTLSYDLTNATTTFYNNNWRKYLIMNFVLKNSLFKIKQKIKIKI